MPSDSVNTTNRPEASPPQPRAALVDPLAGSLGGLAAIVVAAILTPFRETVFGNTNAALVLVVVVAAAASLGGRGAGMVTALVAALSYNFFLTRPYLSLHVDHATDLLTVVLLVVVGFVIGEFARNRFRHQRGMQRASRSSHRLERVAELLAMRTEAEAFSRSVADEVRDELGAADVEWRPGPTATGLPQLERSGWIPGPVHHHRADGFALPPEMELPVTSAGERLGALVVTSTSSRLGVSLDQRRTAVALTDLLAVALVANG